MEIAEEESSEPNKKLVQKLKKSEQIYRNLFKSSLNAIFLVDIEGNILDCNSKAEELFRYKSSELIGKNFTAISLIPHNYLSLVKKMFQSLFKGGIQEEIEIKIYRLDGSFAWLTLIAKILKLENELFIQLFVLDITEQIEIQDDLIEEEELNQMILDSLPFFMMLIRKNRTILSANKIALEVGAIIGDKCWNTFGHCNFIPKKDRDFVDQYGIPPPNSTRCYFCQTEEAFAGQTPKHKDVYVYGKIFDTYWIPFDNDTFIHFAEDVTDRRRAETKLKLSKEKYREAFNLVNIYKDLFAHDMNNILQDILSSAFLYSLIQNKSEKLKEFGDLNEIIKNHVNRGVALITRVIQLSKLEETEIKFKSIEIYNILNKSIEIFISNFQERNVKIDVNGLSKNMKILGNDLLADIFDNILSNALKYNENNFEVKIEINISKVLESDTSYIKFEFKDHGVGVQNERKKMIFENKFNKNIKNSGMGIGLTLVKKIINKFGGRIWVEDRIQGDFTKGSNFIVMLKEAI